MKTVKANISKETQNNLNSLFSKLMVPANKVKNLVFTADGSLITSSVHYSLYSGAAKEYFTVNILIINSKIRVTVFSGKELSAMRTNKIAQNF